MGFWLRWVPPTIFGLESVAARKLLLKPFVALHAHNLGPPCDKTLRISNFARLILNGDHVFVIPSSLSSELRHSAFHLHWNVTIDPCVFGKMHCPFKAYKFMYKPCITIYYYNYDYMTITLYKLWRIYLWLRRLRGVLCTGCLVLVQFSCFRIFVISLTWSIWAVGLVGNFTVIEITVSWQRKDWYASVQYFATGIIPSNLTVLIF